MKKIMIGVISASLICSTSLLANDFEELNGSSFIEEKSIQIEKETKETLDESPGFFSSVDIEKTMFNSEDIYMFNYQSDFSIPEATLEVTGDESGLYVLDNYNIKYNNNQYFVDLDFKTIKDGNINFQKQVGISIMYSKGNRNIWIKYNNKTYKHLVPNKFIQKLEDEKFQTVDKIIDLKLENLKLTIVIPEID